MASDIGRTDGILQLMWCSIWGAALMGDVLGVQYSGLVAVAADWFFPR
jgi:hypothetical protein